jgi:hypothetical protein
VIGERVIVEVKATTVLGPTDKRQLLNYLRATNVEVGLLLHFGPEPRFHRLIDQRLSGTGAKSFDRKRSNPAVSASSA